MRIASALLALLAIGCGHGGPSVRARPAKAEAVREFDSAVRLIRLGPPSYGRALERLSAARAIDPSLWEAWYDAGWLLEALHRDSEARSAYEHALTIFPEHEPSVRALSSIALRQRRFSDASRLLKNFLKRTAGSTASDTALRIELAATLRQEGKLDDATEELRTVLRREPRAAAALSGLGLVYEARGKHELAELVLRRALEVASGDEAGAVWNNLGLVLLAQRRDQEAFAALDKAAALAPNLAEARQNRASIFLDCGDYAAAARELEKLVQAQPQNGAAWVALGVGERGRGRITEARRAYERALALDANDAAALYNEGVLLMDFAHDGASAMKRFDDLVRVAPNFSKRADVDRRLGDLRSAAKPAGPKK